MKKMLLVISILFLGLKSYSCVGPMISITKDTMNIDVKSCCGNVMDEPNVLQRIDKLKPIIVGGSLFLDGDISFNCCNSSTLTVIKSDTLITISKTNNDTGKLCTCVCYQPITMIFNINSSNIHIKCLNMDTTLVVKDAIDEKFIGSRVEVYPNPTNKYITVKINYSNIQSCYFNLIDESGIVTNKFVIKANIDNVFDVSMLKPGMYFYEIVNNQDKIKKGKVVINAH